MIQQRCFRLEHLPTRHTFKQIVLSLLLLLSRFLLRQIVERENALHLLRLVPSPFARPTCVKRASMFCRRSSSRFRFSSSCLFLRSSSIRACSFARSSFAALYRGSKRFTKSTRRCTVWLYWRRASSRLLLFFFSMARRTKRFGASRVSYWQTEANVRIVVNTVQAL